MIERHMKDGRKFNARLLDKLSVLRPKTLGGDQVRTLIYLLPNELLNFNDAKFSIAVNATSMVVRSSMLNGGQLPLLASCTHGH